MSESELSERMKGYERAFRNVLPGRSPVIIRVDGKAFSQYTQRAQKPFDERFSDLMVGTARRLCDVIQGAQLAYTQSDEISVLVHGYKTFHSQSWFDNQVQKMVSIAAGTASAYFSVNSWKMWAETGWEQVPDSDSSVYVKPAVFDARAFTLPESEVCNYFLWRQKDASRNSIQMLARSLHSHKEIDGKNGSEMQEMCFQKGQNWNDLPSRYRRGSCIVRTVSEPPAVGWAPGDPEPVRRPRWEAHLNIPLFNQDRAYIERHLVLEEG
jgi:tRNA(His) 5'-end guanylyltransferase